jgi:pSer/pThr/pTyr-binding forkhead associated (FHA) protein
MFDIPASGAAIGRDLSNTISLPIDAMVSRRHASIAPDAGALLLKDEGSSNGTFVNNQRIQQHRLRPGDEIRIGASLFRFEG